MAPLELPNYPSLGAVASGGGAIWKALAGVFPTDIYSRVNGFQF
jgi:hypothetical protein